jgi:hypothetical protein
MLKTPLAAQSSRTNKDYMGRPGFNIDPTIKYDTVLSGDITAVAQLTGSAV